MEKLFKLQENHTTVKTEVLAGITTFMTMAYILAVNPSILAAAGMDEGAVFTATALASMVGTLLMAVFTNYPFTLMPGMGINAYFAYSVVIGMGYSWQLALTAVFIEGILFILLTVTNVREAVFNAIPHNLKVAVGVGIGLFIAFIGLQNANIIVGGSTLVELFSIEGFNRAKGVTATFQDAGISVLLAVIGVMLMATLTVLKTKGGILWGILLTWGVGMVCQAAGIYVPNPEIGFYSLFPDFSNGFAIPSLAPTFLKFEFDGLFSLNFLVVILAFLFVDFFDTIGALVGIPAKAGMLDKEDRLPKVKGALLADAMATTAGAVFGTSAVTTVAECATGIAAGGRTGLTAVTTAVLFGLSLFISPVFLAIPAFATAPALIIVGFHMFTEIKKIDFEQLNEGIAAFICITAMIFCYSISEGISMGVISYVGLNLFSGNRKKISPLMAGLAILFIAKYFIL